MAVAAALAILCYISPNPSPMRVTISGTPAQVAMVREKAAGTKAFHLLAAAEDRGIAFARFELGSNAPYRDIAGLIFEIQRRRLMIATDQTIASCSDGRVEDVGDSHAGPIRVGLFGETAAIEALRSSLPWATLGPIRLADGRSGLSFVPGENDGIAYRLFVEQAAAAKFPDVEVVLLGEDAAAD